MDRVYKTNKDPVVTESILGRKLKKALDEQNKRNFEIFATKQDLKDLEHNIKTELKADINKNQVYLEKIVAKLDKKEEEGLMHGYQHKLAEDRLADHAKRIEKLEKVIV